MISRNTVAQEHRQHVAYRNILAGGCIALALAFAAASEARASTYQVFTNSAASSMTLNANDGVCSLAEAVEHAKGNTVYNCTDFAPGSGEQRIELLESQNKPFSTNHFKITSLTLRRQDIRIHIFGSGGFIDSTGASAFVVPFRSIAFFERVTLTNTAGSAGGRLIENYGELQLYGVTITKGDVTGAQHPTGRGGGIFNGNTSNGLYPAKITFAENSLITGNKAKRGGGIYNDAGLITELAVTISNNSATLAGGGIYNWSADPPGNGGFASGKIWLEYAGGAIQGNSARAGGGIFNRGGILLRESSITGNRTTTTGSSGEQCYGSPSCDGLGGGVLSVHAANASDTMFDIARSAISNNSASGRGGGIYSAGVLELGGNTINNNKAPDGAAIYVDAPTDGTQFYCNVYGDDGNNVGSATINGNSVNPPSSQNFSIVSGNPPGGATSVGACWFHGMPYLTATSNSNPYCKSTAVRNMSCPQ